MKHRQDGAKDVVKNIIWKRVKEFFFQIRVLKGLYGTKSEYFLSGFRPGVFEFGTSYRKSVAHVSAQPVRGGNSTVHPSPSLMLYIHYCFKKHPLSNVLFFFGLLYY